MLVTPLYARSRAIASYTTDPDYLSALATADQFLFAWQSGERGTAVIMPASDTKHEMSREKLRKLLDSGSGAAYELGRGRKLRAGRYSFPVALFQAAPGGPPHSSHPYYPEIIVTTSGKGEPLVVLSPDLALGVWTRNKPGPSVGTDSNYILALAAANRFLHAWQALDYETGLVMLTDNAKRDISEPRLQAFLSPGPQAAFELARGKKLHSRRYAFPVVLFGVRQDGKTIRPRLSELVVVRTGKDDWAIDKLP